MTGSRRTFVVGAGAATAIALLPRGALAAYPDRPIRLIVPFAAGGNADIVGRLVGEQITKALGQAVVVENRGGAGGGVGAEAVAQAAPDGYTLLVGSNGPLTVNPFVNANLKYDPIKDFAPIALTSYVPHGIVVSKAVEAKNIAELIALSKKAPVTIATAGVGSATHMSLERLKAITGADLMHVPYRGGGSLLPDVISGNVKGAMTEFSTALSLHTGGEARIIAVAALQRSKIAPDIPTFDEGGVKDFKAQSYIGILAPAKTPQDIIAALQQAIEKGLAPTGPAAERLAGIGAEIATPEQMTSKGFAEFIRADYEDMRAAAKLAGFVSK
ncbi:tripartite tricarboxylate transporter substrate binding protein [Bradyrhizobium sp. LHD-71]|uniref:Bug family tripartite tricarboxylate transporter substrate binding protein n=1 Tax=Bradyrhizobium sp. LHD-71 TaxID=3072141 RepID=UPI00280F3835|nr:tripartite tricarboxylate transporter substrate binding protein [Bradyrhizobium sp. LHD-71]MDQ8730126.1 tripartite tricarboxylate transporter substrate binding protein [Bradyrhizobium sp. LHD-71]